MVFPWFSPPPPRWISTCWVNRSRPSEAVWTMRPSLALSASTASISPCADLFGWVMEANTESHGGFHSKQMDSLSAGKSKNPSINGWFLGIPPWRNGNLQSWPWLFTGTLMIIHWNCRLSNANFRYMNYVIMCVVFKNDITWTYDVTCIFITWMIPFMFPF